MNDEAISFYFFALAIGALLCGLIAMVCAHRTRKGLAFFLGVFFGPIGILIAAVMRPTDTGYQAPAATAAAPVRNQPAEFPELPDQFEIRRGSGASAQHYGPYPLDAVLNYLADGTLLPTDQYRTLAGHWALLSRTGLV